MLRRQDARAGVPEERGETHRIGVGCWCDPANGSFGAPAPGGDGLGGLGGEVANEGDQLGAQRPARAKVGHRGAAEGAEGLEDVVRGGGPDPGDRPPPGGLPDGVVARDVGVQAQRLVLTAPTRIQAESQGVAEAAERPVERVIGQAAPAGVQVHIAKGATLLFGPEHLDRGSSRAPERAGWPAAQRHPARVPGEGRAQLGPQVALVEEVEVVGHEHQGGRARGRRAHDLPEVARLGPAVKGQQTGSGASDVVVHPWPRSKEQTARK